MPSHYYDDEYKGSEHATDVFKAPKKEKTAGQKLEESGEFMPDPEKEDLSQQVNYSKKTDIKSLTNLQRQQQDAKKYKKFDDAVSNAQSPEDLIKAGEIRKQIEEAEDEIDPETGWPMYLAKGAWWALQKVGEGFDWVDKQAGIPGTDIDVYHARRKILDPLSETHLALGILGEIFLPDSIDIATAGFSYIPNRFRKAGKAGIKLWADITKAGKGADSVKLSKAEASKLFGYQTDEAGNLTQAFAHTGDFNRSGDDITDAILNTNTLDPKGLKDWGSNKRKSGARFITGKTVQDEAAFIQGGWKVFARISSKFGIDINRATSPLQIHHKGVIRQIAESLNGLTDEAAKTGGDLISKKLGYKLGYDPQNAAPVPAKFHQRIHDLINDHISIRWGDNLKGLEEKLNLPSNWKTTMDLQARIDAGIYDEIVAGINESTDAIDTFWKSLQTRTNLGKLSKDEFLDATLEVVELDRRLSGLQRTRHLSPEEGYTATQAVNEILERAGRIDLQSPIFDKLDVGMSQDLIKILIQRNGEKALREVLKTGQDPETIFQAYGLTTKGYDKLFKQLTLPGFTDIKDPFAGKPLGRPKGSKDRIPRKKRDKKTKPKPDKRSRRKYPETGEGLDEFGNPL